MFRGDIYQLLEINNKVSAHLVKKSFRDFAKNNHPDIFPGDKTKEERFKKVSSAYQSWKLVQIALDEIKRIREKSAIVNSVNFEPWEFA